MNLTLKYRDERIKMTPRAVYSSPLSPSPSLTFKRRCHSASEERERVFPLSIFYRHFLNEKAEYQELSLRVHDLFVFKSFNTNPRPLALHLPLSRGRGLKGLREFKSKHAGMPGLSQLIRRTRETFAVAPAKN